MQNLLTALTSTAALTLGATGVHAQIEALGEWVTMSGTVASVDGTNFTLEHGDGDIVVELDGYDSMRDTMVEAGERVTVSGRIDDDFFKSRSLEASSVFREDESEYLFASSADEEDGYYPYPVWTPSSVDAAPSGTWVAFSGRVDSIDGATMMVDTGSDLITVATGSLESNPIDDQGPKTVEVGERVSVTGEVDDADLFEAREITASSIVGLGDPA